MIGQKFGRLLVLKEDTSKKNKKHGKFYETKCECGKLKTYRSDYIKQFIKNNRGCYSCGIEIYTFWKIASEEQKLEKLKQSFEKFVIKTQNNCWGWKGTLSSNYGFLQFGIKNKRILAHRASWLIHNGPIPNELFVLHNCPGGDNPSCSNPSHLFLGTAKDNFDDMVKKGRKVFKKGEEIHNAKLTDKCVLKILQLIKQNTSLIEIAKLFNVSKSTIYNIKYKKSWKHINLE